MALLVCLTTLTASHQTASLPGRRRFLYKQMTWSDVTFHCKRVQDVELYGAALKLSHGSDQGPNQTITISQIYENVRGERALDIVFLLMSSAMMDGVFDKDPAFADIPEGFDTSLAEGFMEATPAEQLAMDPRKSKHPVFRKGDSTIRTPVTGRRPSTMTDSRVNFLLNAIAKDANVTSSCTQEDLFLCAREISFKVGRTSPASPSDVVERYAKQALSRCGGSTVKICDASVSTHRKQQTRLAEPLTLLLTEHKHRARHQAARIALAALRPDPAVEDSQSNANWMKYRQAHIKLQFARKAIQDDTAAHSQYGQPSLNAFRSDQEWIWVDAAKKEDYLGFANIRDLAATYARDALRQFRASKPRWFSAPATSSLMLLDKYTSSRSELFGELSSISRTLTQGSFRLSLLDFLSEQTSCAICGLSLAEASRQHWRNHLRFCTNNLLSSVYLTSLGFLMEERSGGLTCSHSECMANQSTFASYEAYCRHVASIHLDHLVSQACKSALLMHCP